MYRERGVRQCRVPREHAAWLAPHGWRRWRCRPRRRSTSRWSRVGLCLSELAPRHSSAGGPSGGRRPTHRPAGGDGSRQASAQTSHLRPPPPGDRGNWAISATPDTAVTSVELKRPRTPRIPSQPRRGDPPRLLQRAGRGRGVPQAQSGWGTTAESKRRAPCAGA